jgi:hypothetical protein
MEDRPMIVLSLKDSGAMVGRIGEDDFQFLVDQLEEESEEDTDYYITPGTIEMLGQRGGSESLITVLKQAVAGSEGVEVSWTRE